MVIAMAKLHNFCIDDSKILEGSPLALDGVNNYIMNNANGCIEIIVDEEHGINIQSDLMDARHLFDDVQ